MSRKQLKCPHCDSINSSGLKYELGAYKLFECSSCSNGFINPIPKNLAKFYPENYWNFKGYLGLIRTQIYNYFQNRRLNWVKSRLKKGTTIIDIGSGEAEFAKKMHLFQVTNIDFPGSKIKNPVVLKVDFLKWQTKNHFDAIVFWESLEHIPNSGLYLKKAYQLLKKGGLIFIECPRLDSVESRLFKQHWYHLDPPRHLLHFSQKGIMKILEKNNFTNIHIYNVFAPEYAFPGSLVSIANFFGLSPVKSYLNNSIKNQIVPLFLLSPFAFIFELLLLLTGNSPIMLAVAKKN